MAKLSQDIFPSALERLERNIAFCQRVAWVLVFFGFTFGMYGFHRLDELDKLGSYLQGTTGSLFALAGLMFIYVAFLGQKQQLIIQSEQLQEQKKQFERDQEIQEQALRQQREELEITRQDSAEQRKKLEAQSNAMKRQIFESSFFQLLKNHNQIVSSLSDGNMSSPRLSGRECFQRWLEQLTSTKLIPTRDDYHNIQMLPPKSAIDRYEFFYETKQAVLGHYFRNLYHVFKFVKDSEIDNAEKRRYTSLVRATLSQGELALLFYNCLSVYGSQKFKPLVEEFGLLENLNCDLVDEMTRGRYDQKAFL